MNRCQMGDVPVYLNGTDVFPSISTFSPVASTTQYYAAPPIRKDYHAFESGDSIADLTPVRMDSHLQGQSDHMNHFMETFFVGESSNHIVHKEEKNRIESLEEDVQAEYIITDEESKQAIMEKHVETDKRRRAEDRHQDQLDCILRESNDIEDDSSLSERMKEEKIRQRRADAARLRYQRMSEQERKLYNHRRRLRALGLDPESGMKRINQEGIKEHIKSMNQRKAEQARVRYHRMNDEEKRIYNQRRTEAFRRKRVEEEVLLSTPAGRISAESLQKAQQIMLRNSKKAEAARARYQRMTPEQRREYNQRRAQSKKLKEKRLSERTETPECEDKKMVPVMHNKDNIYVSVPEHVGPSHELDGRMTSPLDSAHSMSSSHSIDSGHSLDSAHQMESHPEQARSTHSSNSSHVHENPLDDDQDSLFRHRILLSEPIYTSTPHVHHEVVVDQEGQHMPIPPIQPIRRFYRTEITREGLNVQQKLEEQRARRAERARARYHNMSEQQRAQFNTRRAMQLRKARERDEQLVQLAENEMNLDEEMRKQVEDAQIRRQRRAEAARAKYHRMSSEERRQYNAMRDAQRRQRKRDMEVAGTRRGDRADEHIQDGDLMYFEMYDGISRWEQ